MPTNIEDSGTCGKRDGLFSVQEASSYLRMSPSWLYGCSIPFVRLGRRRRYRRDDLDRFVEQNVSHGNQKRRT
jgi:excisionase family DNA binding protein